MHQLIMARTSVVSSHGLKSPDLKAAIDWVPSPFLEHTQDLTLILPSPGPSPPAEDGVHLPSDTDPVDQTTILALLQAKPGRASPPRRRELSPDPKTQISTFYLRPTAKGRS